MPTIIVGPGPHASRDHKTIPIIEGMIFSVSCLRPLTVGLGSNPVFLPVVAKCLFQNIVSLCTDTKV